MSHTPQDPFVDDAHTVQRGEYVTQAHTDGRIHDARIQDDRSIGEIVGDVSQNFSTLVSQELALAKAEAMQSVQRGGKGAGMLAAAGVAASMALLFISLGAWWAIAILIGNHDHPALGWSGLIMCVLWALAAAALASAGKKALQQVPGLPRTQETVSKIPNAVKGNEEKNR